MRPIVVIDIESTGKDVCKDRIVELAIDKYQSIEDTRSESRHFLFNPGIPIHAEAIEIHGIKDSDVADKPKFADHASSLADFLTGCDIAGFNIIAFDVPMLSEEFARCGIIWPSAGARFLDSFHVYKTKERRDLAAALQFYCGIDHVNHHEAKGDIEAAWVVMVAQMHKYEDIPDTTSYAAFCANPKAIDLAGKIELNDEGIAVYAFGKDKGKSVQQFPGFGEWMLKPEQTFSSNTKNVVRSLLTRPK